MESLLIKRVLMVGVPICSSASACFLFFSGNQNKGVSLKSLFDVKKASGRVLLSTSDENHDSVWNAIVEEIKKDVNNERYPDLPNKANLTSDELKSYCGSLAESKDGNIYGKYEKLCSRNSWKVELGDFVSGSDWQARNEKFGLSTGMRPSLGDSKTVEEWCNKRGSEPWTVKEGNNSAYYDIYNWCTVQGIENISD